MVALLGLSSLLPMTCSTLSKRTPTPQPNENPPDALGLTPKESLWFTPSATRRAKLHCRDREKPNLVRPGVSSRTRRSCASGSVISSQPSCRFESQNRFFFRPCLRLRPPSQTQHLQTCLHMCQHPPVSQQNY